MTTRLLLEGPDLAELVAHVREEFGPRARIVQAERIRSGGFAGFFATERYELTVDVPDEPARAPRRFARNPAPPPPPAAPADGLEALLAAADEADAGPGPTTAGRAATDPVPGSEVSTGSEAFADVLRQVRSLVGAPDPDVVVADAPPAVPAAAPPAGPVTAPGAAHAVATAGSPRLRAELARLGVPATVLDAGPVTLTAVLGRIPVPPPAPRGPGQVLVVAGTGEMAATVARTLAARWGLPLDAVPELSAPATADALRALRDPGAPRVVAVRVGPDAHDRTLAARLLRELRPEQLWAVVDARTKPADAAAWVGAVGADRPVDALAVHGLLDTTAPGTVLELDLPVAWADGLPASRLLWAAALGQELDAVIG